MLGMILIRTSRMGYGRFRHMLARTRSTEEIVSIEEPALLLSNLDGSFENAFYQKTSTRNPPRKGHFDKHAARQNARSRE
ncbi:hypothetical protein JMJ78_0000893, partial [Colletotrichum scovillei]